MVVDIKKLDDNFKETNFFIDTNVLYWLSYSKYDFLMVEPESKLSHT
jgi:hypothetical protein